MNARGSHVSRPRAATTRLSGRLRLLIADGRFKRPSSRSGKFRGTLAGTYRDNLNLALIRSLESTVPVTTSPSSTYWLRFGA